MMTRKLMSADSKTSYEYKIPAVKEYRGTAYPLPLDDEDCTLQDQIIDKLQRADDEYAEAIAGYDCDPAFNLIDAIQMLKGAIETLEQQGLCSDAIRTTAEEEDA